MKYQGVFIKGASGSLGGLVASHNRFGDYFRGRTIPVNPSSNRQQAVRSVFASLAWAWSNVLTDANRLKWNTYAGIVTVKDSGGNDIYITGFNHFIRSNSVALGGGVTQVNDGPLNFTLAEQDPTMSAVVDEATQKVTVTFDDTMVWCDEDDAVMQISMSKPCNAGVNFVPPTARIAGYILGDAGTPPTTGEELDCPFPVIEGNIVQVTGRILRADGRLSGTFLDTSAVTA